VLNVVKWQIVEYQMVLVLTQPTFMYHKTRRLYVEKHLPLPVDRYSFVLMSELEQLRMNKIAHGATWQHRIQIQALSIESRLL